MKTRMLIFGLLLAVAVIASGCTTVSQSQPSGPLGVKVAAPMKADIEIGEKVSGTASGTILCFFVQLGFPSKFAENVDYNYYTSWHSSPIAGISSIAQIAMGNLKSAAAYDAVTKGKADVLVAPKYIVEANDFWIFQTLNVTVTGYKGTVKGIKPTENFRENF